MSARTTTAKLMPVAAGYSGLLAVGSMVMLANDRRTVLLLGGFIAAVIGTAVVIEPYIGMLLVVAMTYLRPGDWIESLQALRPVLLMMVLTSGIYLTQRVLAGRPLWGRHPLNRYLIGFFLAATWSTLQISLGYTRSVLVAGLGSSMLLYLLVVNLTTTPQRLRTLAFTIGGCCSFNAVISVRAMLAGKVRDKGRASAVGTLGDPNDLAMTLVMMVPLTLALARGSRGLSRWLALGMTALLIGGILGSQSRGGMLALAAVALAECQQSNLRAAQRRALTVGMAVCALMLLNIMYLRRGASLSGVSKDANAVSRKVAWGIGLRLLAEHPHRGVGLEMFPDWFEKYRPRDLDAERLTAHNSIILVAGEMGLPGLFFFLPLLWHIGEAAKRVRTRVRAGALANATRGPACAPLFESLGRGYLGWLVSAMFLSQAYRSWLYLMIAMIVAAERMVGLPGAEQAGAKVAAR